MKRLLICIILLGGFDSVYGGTQKYEVQAYWQMHFSRLARVVALGNTYSGIAEGLETIYYNSAGLAFANQYGVIYSSGHGLEAAYSIVLKHPRDVAVALPFSKQIGTFAISYSYLDLAGSKVSLYRLLYSRLLLRNLSMGVSGNFYRNRYSYLQFVGRSEFGPEYRIASDTKRTYDLSVSVLYRLQNLMVLSLNNEIRIGLQIQNALGSATSDVSFLNQHVRFGFAYILSPNFLKFQNKNLLSVLFAFDSVYENRFESERYSFDYWQPNFGIELGLLKLVSLRYGNERLRNIKEIPYDQEKRELRNVKRYGFGLNIPIKKFLAKLDYADAKWEDKTISVQLLTKF